MSETIKTVLTADSRELRAEFNKAAAALADYQAKQEASFAKARAGHDLELRALRLEADGFKSLANSMRESTSLREQAQKFAAAANLTEGQALAMLTEKNLLQKNILAATRAEESARKDAAAATSLQAAAMSELAREAAAAEARTLGNMRSGYEAQSAAILQATAAARKSEQARAAAIANPRATGLPGGGALAPLTPQGLAAMDRHIAQTRELRRQTIAAGRGGQGGAMGFLAFSQAVEDAQYGIKGVLNNIPQMIMGFGGSMGLAGAISLAAVAAAVLYPRLKELYGAADTERLKESAEEWARIWESGRDAAQAQYEAFLSSKELVVESGRIAQYYRERISLGLDLAKMDDEAIDRRREEVKMQEEILDAQAKLARIQGNESPVKSSEKKIRELTELEAELNNRKKAQLNIIEQINAAEERRKNISEENGERDISQKSRLLQLQENLAAMEANFAASEKQRKGIEKDKPGFGGELVTWLFTGPDGVNSARSSLYLEWKSLQENADILKPKIKALKEEIAQLGKVQEAHNGEAEKAVTALQNNIDELDARNDKTYQEEQALRKLIEQKKKLLDIEKQIEEANQAASDKEKLEASVAAAKKAFENANRQAQKSAEDAAKAEKRNAEIQSSRAAAAAEMNTEIAALKLQVAGRDDLADSLRSEMNLRREAIAYAERAGLTEEAALKVLREKKALEDEIAKGRPRARGIRRRENGAMDMNAGNNLNQWKWNLGQDSRKIGFTGAGSRRIGLGDGNASTSLRADALSRRSRERAASARPEDATKNYFSKSIDLQEQIVKIFAQLGIV